MSTSLSPKMSVCQDDLIGIQHKFVRYLAARFKISGIYKNYKSRGDLPSFYSDLSSYIERLPVDVRASSYSNYYSDKDEDQNIKFCNEWNNKQKEVHNAINSSNINTVFDVACNTDGLLY